VTSPRAGTVNVAGAGAVPLSQVLRWAGRVRLPLPGRAVRAVLRDVVDLGDEDERFLMYGRVVDTTVLTEEVGLRCRHPTATALREAVAAAPALPRVGIAALGAVEAALRSRSSEPTTTVTR
jgi:UDP-glucose 4-epimerase